MSGMSERDFLWPTRESAPQLCPDEIHIWAWDLDRELVQADWDVLSLRETQRAHRFVYPQDRDRFVRAHAIMRRLLANYLALAPAEILYETNAYGKPEIASTLSNQATLHFNLSHSAHLAVLAVCQHDELGVDIEVMRTMGPEVAERHFSALERQTLDGLPAEIWQRGFYRCWTSKEALLKGAGLGLNVALDAFDVESDPHRTPALLTSRTHVLTASNWSMIQLEPAIGVMGTLAVQGDRQSTLHSFSFNG